MPEINVSQAVEGAKRLRTQLQGFFDVVEVLEKIESIDNALKERQAEFDNKNKIAADLDKRIADLQAQIAKEETKHYKNLSDMKVSYRRTLAEERAASDAAVKQNQDNIAAAAKSHAEALAKDREAHDAVVLEKLAQKDRLDEQIAAKQKELAATTKEHADLRASIDNMRGHARKVLSG